MNPRSARWTILAGYCFVWNVVAYRSDLPPITELSRRHPWVAGPIYLCLGYHLAPWRSPQVPS